MDSVEYLSFGRWTSKRFLLLMGCSATKEDVTALAKNRIPLAGVLTTTCDDRQLEDYMDWLAEAFNVSVSIEEYMSNTRTSQRLTMVKLLETADTSGVDKYFGDSIAARTPEFKANRLQRALLGNAPLWIIGFDRANQFDSDASIPLLKHLKNRGSETIFFWGMAPSTANDPLQKYAEETDQGYFEETISAAFAQVEQDISEDASVEYSPAAEVSDDFYYSGGAVVSVDSVQIRRYSATATLLTLPAFPRMLLGFFSSLDMLSILINAEKSSEEILSKGSCIWTQNSWITGSSLLSICMAQSNFSLTSVKVGC